MTAAPLTDGHGDQATIGFDGEPVGIASFLAAVDALSARLPAGECCLLLCENRVCFALGFAAALVRGVRCLLPPSRAGGAIDDLVALHRPAFALTDGAQAAGSLPCIAVGPVPATSRRVRVPRITASQVAAIVFTSGTTGEPCPHPKTWGSLVAGAQALRERIRFGAGDAVVGMVPPQHMWGLEATVMLPLQSGGVIDASMPLLPADLAIAALRTGRPTRVVMTPLHLRSLVQAGKPMPALAGALVATSSLDAEDAARFEQLAGVALIEIYGSTETGAVATRRTARAATFAPLRGVDVRASDGGIVVQGGHVERATAIGDRIEVRGDGTFAWVGREADLVKVGGKRASLAALNRELRQVPGVRDGEFVVSRADALTPRLAAVVVAPGTSRAAILRALRARIDPVFLPRPLVIVAQLPRNVLGKASLESLARLVDGRAALAEDR